MEILLWLNLFEFRDLLGDGFQRDPTISNKSFQLETFRASIVFFGALKCDRNEKSDLFQTSSLSWGRRKRLQKLCKNNIWVKKVVRGAHAQHRAVATSNSKHLGANLSLISNKFSQWHN